jgi:hypothetical protein
MAACLDLLLCLAGEDGDQGPDLRRLDGRAGFLKF